MFLLLTLLTCFTPLRAGPYCLGLPPEECSQLLKSLLTHQVSIRPGWCVALVRLEMGSRRLFPSQADLVQAVMAGVCMAVIVK